MDTQRKAVPTEYAGVRFRSKSEACFAMYLDHHSEFWQYEPELLTLECGYVPDFLVIRHHYHSKQGKWFSAILIEYKPSQPTETYVQTHLDKLDLLSHHVGFRCYGKIYYGSFFEQSAIVGTVSRHPDSGQESRCDTWLHGSSEWPLRHRIAQHRFDLVSELSAWKGHL